MADIDQLTRALVNADAAGDVDAARALAGEISRMRQGGGVETTAPAAPKMADDGRNNLKGKVGAALRGVADTMTFGMTDEIIAGLDTMIGKGDGYADNLAFQRKLAKDDAEQRGGYRVSGQLAGGVTSGLGLAKAGLSFGANAAKSGLGLGRIALGGAADGAIMGGLGGAGSGEDLASRLTGAATGTVAGGAIGGAVPFGVAGAAMAAKPLIAPIMSRLRPDAYAESALGEGLKRSGATADDIANRLMGARADGQEVFTVADAMGNAGQRMLSTVARNPSDARQGVIDALLGRQMDQGRRVAGALQDATGTPLTAAQYKTMLEAQRGTDAARNYAPVKLETQPIDVSRPVGIANRAISPAADMDALARGRVPTDLAARAGVEGQEAVIRDPIASALKEARSYLAAPDLTLSNVNKAFRAKTNIDQMIANATEKGQGALVAELAPVRDALDEALAATSKSYAGARDSYRGASQVVDAVDTGRAMAAPRSRPGDNLSTFGALPNDEAQRAARIGYFDPLIARAENQAGTMSNSARPLISESFRQEMPVLAAPGAAPQLGRRIAREQRMFETSNAAMGGSKTADNLADAADASRFDPGIMSQLLRGRPIDAAISAITRGIGEAQGKSTPVIERLAKALMERDPEVARQLLGRGASASSTSDARRALVNMLLTSSGAAGAGRLTAP